MGRAILEVASADPEVGVAGLIEAETRAGGSVRFRDRVLAIATALPEVDRAVLVEFSVPEATVAHVREAVARGWPAVVGTTGLSAAHRAELERAARAIPVVLAANMSVGLNLLAALVRRASAALGESADVEIVEMHHNRKQDAPSGSALYLARSVNEGLGRPAEAGLVHGRSGTPGTRPKGEIGIHALRGGDVIGDHTVVFALAGERLELTHRAHTREAFARGAVRAAKFAAGARPGLHGMEKVLGLAA
jgi:4-hydroxy-tetrahydrodipicolinate reductase